MNVFQIVKRLFAASATKQTETEPYDFDKSNPLGGGGERVDILFDGKIVYENLDIYQKNHFRRYEFACTQVPKGSICGDFACGTGYGTVMLSQFADAVVGADLNSEVIEAITERYKENAKVSFLNANLLDLDFHEKFDAIVSFETIEHFSEENIQKLLTFFAKAIKPGGKLIFSTPYNQERTEDAIKMGFHLTFNITESTIEKWLADIGFQTTMVKYQNYQDHIVYNELENKEFILVVSEKIS